MAKYRIKGTSGASANRSFELEQRLLFGRADDCDVRIDQDSIAPRHCELVVADDGSVILNDLGSETGTRVNGTQVETVSLASGDEISVGNCRFLLQAPGLRPERVLTEKAVRKPRNHVPWLLITALLLTAALVWQRGWVQGLTG